MQLQLKHSETVLKVGVAERIGRLGLTSVRGYLWLTNLRLVFQSLALLQRYEDSYPLAEIASVQPVNTLGLLPNRISIVFQDGRQEDFLVNEQKDWLAKIAGAKLNTSPGALPSPQTMPPPGAPPTFATYATSLDSIWKPAVAIIALGFLLLLTVSCCISILFVMLNLSSR